jgi:cytochrome c peroxidase
MIVSYMAEVCQLRWIMYAMAHTRQHSPPSTADTVPATHLHKSLTETVTAPPQKADERRLQCPISVMTTWLLALALIIPLGLDLFMPVPEQNSMTREKIDLGRRLFHDRRFSRDRSVACVSCHDPDRAVTDGRRFAIGASRKLGRRNAPALINRGYGRAFFWDGRAATLEEQVLQPIQDPSEMNLTLGEVSRRVGLSSDEIFDL